MNKFLKESLITIAFVLMSTNAMAAEVDTATGVFQWSGKVPEAHVNYGFCIAEVEGKTPHASGVITFHNKQGTDDSVTHDIQSSSELAFKVYMDHEDGKPCGTYKAVDSYRYVLTDLKVGINAEQMQSQDSKSNWQVMHAKSGTAIGQLKSHEPVKNLDGSEVSLTLAGEKLAVDSGDSVVAHAYILLTDIDRSLLD